MGVCDQLQPKTVFAFFEAICQIPHGSGNEEALSRYLVQFAEQRNLWVHRDEANNVIIKKLGTTGCEQLPPVILQAHIDMVCEKNEDKAHDFLTDPLSLRIDGDFLMADQTTLGADDGIGAAYMLALLDGTDCVHPPIEALFTTGEEVGMEGAIALHADLLQGKTLINIDSEDEGKLYISCAGGMRANLHIAAQFQEKTGQAYQLFISGLQGGHSGMDITLERGNANKLMGRLLNRVAKELAFDLAFVEGGGKDNAIAREARAVVCIDPKHEEKLFTLVKQMEAELQMEYKNSDSGVQVVCSETTGTEKVLTDKIKESVITALMLIPNGVQTMSVEIANLPESSTNVGVIHCSEDEIVFGSAIRSSVASKKMAILDQIESLAKAIGATVTTSGGYPGWQYDKDSKLRPLFVDVYEKMTGQKPEIIAVHAGLECGIFAEKIKGLDMISFGPNVYNAHTPQEKISIASTRRTWEYFQNVLREICRQEMR